MIRLIAFLEKNFPEIPAHLRAAIVVAATAGARHAALLHVVHGSNINSPYVSKRVFAAEADSALSFWALGLRATDREIGSPKSAASGAPPAESCDYGRRSLLSDDVMYLIYASVQ